jgi:hypothetical protein
VVVVDVIAGVVVSVVEVVADVVASVVDAGSAGEGDVVTPAEDSVVDALVRAAGSSEARNTAMSGRHQASLSRRCRRWTSLTTHAVPRRQAFFVLSGSLPFGALRSIAGARPTVAS